MKRAVEHRETESIRPIHVQWDGPFTLEEISKLNDDHDYGIYQVYGSHPVYGSDVLLYVGKASAQTFSVRLNQEEWHYNKDADNIRYYVGRLAGGKTPENSKWKREIDLVEKLLIYSHGPASNSRNISSLGKDSKDLKDILVLNWGKHRDLLSEVSGLMLTDHFDELENYHCYGDENNTLDV